MKPDPHHVRGLALGALGFVEGSSGWFLAHIEAINHLLQFGIYSIAFITTLVGLRKVLRKRS